MFLKSRDRKYSSIIRSMGYLKDQKGILNRYVNERECWEPHVKNCKDAIHDFVHGTIANNVVVLGSGWLIDFPTELFSTQKYFHLLDIKHPRQVKHKYRDFDNVIFHEQDITGGAIHQVYHAVQSYKKDKTKSTIDTITGKGFIFDGTADTCIISLNILNQLDILLVDFLLKYKIYDDEEIKSFRKKIQENHVNTIKSRNALLITDSVEQVHDEKDNPVDSKNLIHASLPRDKMIREWVWQFDTTGNYHPGRKTIFTVSAYLFNKKEK
jgi:hypothetical protein